MKITEKLRSEARAWVQAHSAELYNIMDVLGDETHGQEASSFIMLYGFFLSKKSRIKNLRLNEFADFMRAIDAYEDEADEQQG